MVRTEVSSPVPKQGFLILLLMNISIHDLELYDLDRFNFETTQDLYKQALLEINPNDFKKIRTQNYWDIRDRIKDGKPKHLVLKNKPIYNEDGTPKMVIYKVDSKRCRQMKLFLAAYINYLNGDELNSEYLNIIYPKNKIKEKTIQPNLNFHDEKKV